MEWSLSHCWFWGEQGTSCELGAGDEGDRGGSEIGRVGLSVVEYWSVGLLLETLPLGTRLGVRHRSVILGCYSLSG